MKRLAGYALVAVLTMGAVVGIHLLTRPEPPPDPDDVARPDLRRWAMLGCWEVDVRPWAGRGAPAAPDAAPASDTAPAGAGAADTSGAAPASGGREPSGGAAPAAVPAPLAPPSRVLLLSDSVDLYGRELPSYRAAPVPWREERPERALRWFVRADTLWLLWRERGVRAGVALMREPGDEVFRGSARALGDSLDVSARALAWPINCATYRRRADRGWDRR